MCVGQNLWAGVLSDSFGSIPGRLRLLCQGVKAMFAVLNFYAKGHLWLLWHGVSQPFPPRFVFQDVEVVSFLLRTVASSATLSGCPMLSGAIQFFAYWCEAPRC